jgi:dipeptidyl aminopeptidase/acylaminoacyl peptidase
VVAGGIPSDLRKYTDSPIVMRFMGGDNHEMPERYAEASPAFHVSSDDPPVFLYHGKLDFLVTEDQAVDYYEALRAAGVEAELYLHRWRGHMSMFLFGGDAEDKAISFLNRNNSLMRLTAVE